MNLVCSKQYGTLHPISCDWFRSVWMIQIQPMRQGSLLKDSEFSPLCKKGSGRGNSYFWPLDYYVKMCYLELLPLVWTPMGMKTNQYTKESWSEREKEPGSSLMLSTHTVITLLFVKVLGAWNMVKSAVLFLRTQVLFPAPTLAAYAGLQFQLLGIQCFL